MKIVFERHEEPLTWYLVRDYTQDQPFTSTYMTYMIRRTYTMLSDAKSMANSLEKEYKKFNIETNIFSERPNAHAVLIRFKCAEDESAWILERSY